MTAKEQFVPKEMAIKLKEKGFDDPCFGGWDANGEWAYHPDSDIVLDAPLWQQVIDWLETKGVFISICYAAPDTNKFNYRIDNYNPVSTKQSILYKNGRLQFGELTPYGSFANYSKVWYSKRIDAKLEAIEHALKLI